MNKHIEKVEQYKQKVLEKELENLRAKYHEAEYSYADTGQDKYFNKMSIYEKQINEIYVEVHNKEFGGLWKERIEFG